MGFESQAKNFQNIETLDYPINREHIKSARKGMGWEDGDGTNQFRKIQRVAGYGLDQ